MSVRLFIVKSCKSDESDESPAFCPTRPIACPRETHEKSLIHPIAYEAYDVLFYWKANSQIMMGILYLFLASLHSNLIDITFIESVNF